jgi:hypothetical protein
MKTVADVVRTESEVLRNPLPIAALNIQQRKHYSHEPYRKVKTGLNTATATRPLKFTE